MNRKIMLSVLVMLAMFQFMAKPGQAVDCNQVNSYLAACMPYLTGGGSPLPACCDGVRKLKTLFVTTVDKRAACECVKTAANKYPAIKDDAASQLPSKCAVSMDIPISKTTNCQAIN